MPRYLPTIRSGSIALTILLGVVIFATVAAVRISLQVIQTLPERYFDLLPASNSMDLDRDGIPDYIDDSDGDGVADAKDPTPYGKGGRSVLFDI